MDGLRRMRRARGWTQQELARRAGVTQHTISEIERAKQEPYPSTLKKLAGAFEVSVGELTHESPTERALRHRRRCLEMGPGREQIDFLKTLSDQELSELQRVSREHWERATETIREEEEDFGKASNEAYSIANEGVTIGITCSLIRTIRSGAEFREATPEETAEILSALMKKDRKAAAGNVS